MVLCKCGCGKIVKPGNMFLYGHNLKIKKPETEEQKKIRIKKSRETWDKKTDEEKNKIYKKISDTKNSPEGKKIMKLAYLKCKDKIIKSLIGRIPHNKLKEEDRIIKYCLNCNKKMLLTPCLFKVRKYCSRKCMNEYKKGKPAENWNPNSFHGLSGSGVSGEYKGIRFRSTFELSFVYRSFQLGDRVIVEPFKISLKEYLSDFHKRIYKIKSKQKYTPDYLLNGDVIVEIKPEKAYTWNHPSFKMNTMKIIALENYCKKNGYKMLVLTDENMGELILNEKQIRLIPKEDIIFYKQKHREKFKNDNRKTKKIA
jgi:hypothetical protein